MKNKNKEMLTNRNTMNPTTIKQLLNRKAITDN